MTLATPSVGFSVHPCEPDPHEATGARAQEAYQVGGASLQLQVRMQNDAVNMQMLSNMSQMQHQSIKAVAKNMKY